MIDDTDDLRTRITEVRETLWLMQDQANKDQDLWWEAKDRQKYDEAVIESMNFGVAITLIDVALGV